MPLTLVSEGREPHLGAQQASWARMGGANALLSSPAPPVLGLGGPLPPASPDLPGLPTMLPRPMRREAGGEGEALEGRGLAWEFSRLPMPKWEGQSPSAPLPLLPEGPSRLPLLISLASGAPILSGLHFSSPLGPPTSYWFTLGFLLFPWGSESHISGRQAP